MNPFRTLYMWIIQILQKLNERNGSCAKGITLWIKILVVQYCCSLEVYFSFCNLFYLISVVLKEIPWNLSEIPWNLSEKCFLLEQKLLSPTFKFTANDQSSEHSVTAFSYNRPQLLWSWKCCNTKDREQGTVYFLKCDITELNLGERGMECNNYVVLLARVN